MLIGLPALQPSSEFFRAPAAVVAARAQDRFHDRFRRGVGLLVWRARLVGQRGSPAQRIALSPFIASFSTNTVSAALLGEGLIAFFDGFHEGQSLFHGTRFFPAHQLLLLADSLPKCYPCARIDVLPMCAVLTEAGCGQGCPPYM